MTPSNPIPVQAGGPDVPASSGHVQKTAPVSSGIGDFSHTQLIASLERRAEARKGKPGYLRLLQRLQNVKHAVLREGARD